MLGFRCIQYYCRGLQVVPNCVSLQIDIRCGSGGEGPTRKDSCAYVFKARAERDALLSSVGFLFFLFFAET